MAKDLRQLGREMRDALAVLDQSQRWLAQRANVPQSTISRLFTAKIERPDAHIIARLAEALGVDSVRWLALAGVAVERRTGERQADVEIIADRLDSLPEDLREQAVGAVAAVVDAFYNLQGHIRPLADELAAYGAELEDHQEDS